MRPSNTRFSRAPPQSMTVLSTEVARPSDKQYARSRMPGTANFLVRLQRSRSAWLDMKEPRLRGEWPSSGWDDPHSYRRAWAEIELLFEEKIRRCNHCCRVPSYT